jgi:hypothetical protein
MDEDHPVIRRDGQLKAVEVALLGHLARSLFRGISPNPGFAGSVFINRPLWQRDPGRHIGENHSHARSDSDSFDILSWRKYAIRCCQITHHTKRFVGGRLSTLGVQFNHQYEIRQVLLERWLNRVMNFGIGMHRSTALDRCPFRLCPAAPRTRGRGWITKQMAGTATLQAKVMF